MGKEIFHVIQSLCNGCGACKATCSLVTAGAFNSGDERVTLTRDDFSGYQEAFVACDGAPCSGRPVCVEFCPTGALLFDTPENIIQKKKALFEALEQGNAEAKVRAPWAMRR